MDEWRMRLRDDLKAPPGFADDVMTAIRKRQEIQPARGPIYSPVAKGILCIAAAVLLLVLSMPKLDGAWNALAKISPGSIRETQSLPSEDDGMGLPGSTMLYVVNR
jgi:hypothetical protein